MIITIGRQFGSGGSEIGRKVAERLNIPGHIVEAERPQSPQPTRETSGIGTSEVIR